MSCRYMSLIYIFLVQLCKDVGADDHNALVGCGLQLCAEGLQHADVIQHLIRIDEYLGKDNVEWLEKRMTAEDFAFFAQKIPACYFRVGTHVKNTPITNLHRPNLMIDETSIEHAMGFMAYNTIQALNIAAKTKEIK